MQAPNMHLDRVSLCAIEEVIEVVRDMARRQSRYGSKATAEQLRALNEFLLRPASQIVRDLAAVGGSKVEKSPAQLAREAAEAATADAAP